MTWTSAQKVQSIDDFCSHIEVRHSAPYDYHQDGDTCLQLFRDHLFAYLKRAGHPDDKVVQDIIGSKAFQDQAGDSTLRARALLKTDMATNFLPPTRDWKIKVSD